VKYFARGLVGLTALFAASIAQAFELDTLLPDTVPGYGTPLGAIDHNWSRQMDNAPGILIGGMDLDPAITLGIGYDSAPNGLGTGSLTLQQTPTFLVSDKEIGLGAFAAGNFRQYLGDETQNLTSGTLALGDRILLPRETITFSTAYLKAQETGFALNTVALNHPIAFTVADLRASDKISLGMFELIPDISLTNYRFNDFTGQDRFDAREAVTAIYDTGGPGSLVLRLNATQSHYMESRLDAATNEALVGLDDDARGLWNIRLLAGVAQRHGSAGTSVTAPVIEASIDWVPSDLDRVNLHVAREIDDPDAISAEPYTLSLAKFSLAHEYLRNVVLNISMEIDNAAYLKGNLKETVLSTNAGCEWHLNDNMAIHVDYSFNDRQANFLRAANEHVLTLSVIWTQ
jgi:hypothetical protein